MLVHERRAELVTVDGAAHGLDGGSSAILPGSSARRGIRTASASGTRFVPPWEVSPPSTGISAPLMNADSSEIRNTTSGATSLGCAGAAERRPSMFALRNASGADAVIGVSM